MSRMSQLDLRRKLKIRNVRKEEWADPKGNQWAREKSGNNQNRQLGRGLCGSEEGRGATFTW